MTTQQRSYFVTWSRQDHPLGIDFLGGRNHQIFTAEGRVLFDFSSTSYQNSLGHNPPQILLPLQQALTRALSVDIGPDSIVTSGPKFDFPLKENVSAKLLGLLEKKGKIFYTTSGAESVENALKMARQQRGQNVVMACEKGYHGATLGALSVTGDWRNRAHATVDDWTLRFPHPCEDPNGEKLTEIFLNFGPSKIAALIIETITGGNGVYCPPVSWYQALQKLKDQYGLIIILDEIVCGFYRCQKAFGLHHFPIAPDLICLAKNITGGVIPFGALWASEEMAAYYQGHILSQGLTHYAHPLGLLALDAVIDCVVAEEFQQHLRALEKIFADQLRDLQTLPAVLETRWMGLLGAIELLSPIKMEQLLAEGLYINVIGSNLILAPALTTPTDDLVAAFQKLKVILSNAKKE